MMLTKFTDYNSAVAENSKDASSPSQSDHQAEILSKEQSRVRFLLFVGVIAGKYPTFSKGS